MKFEPSPLPGVWVVELEPHRDARGYFARAFCAREFAAHGLETVYVQCNLSGNRHRGTLRGLHWQAAPHEEAKLVRVVRGAVFDAVVDLRPDSPTYLQAFTTVLDAAGGRALYVPRGCAHGFLTLEDNTDVFYQMSEYYVPELARGARWDDPAFSIPWPEPPRFISERDLAHPPFRPAR
ncbi:MAG: dTDP-4-dehydrorhamnose 3,5-epimerase family protein [Kiritimatiellae bacterium]|nr:dTDP-4-dehydrorhamnose 3,5-epimerase family protein [Kiritimatiellia bacterium]